MSERNSRAVVLLSGGMDSSYAATWACRSLEPVAFLFVEYGQRGTGYEKAAAGMVAGWLIDAYKLDASLNVARFGLPYLVRQKVAITKENAKLSPELKDKHGNPATFLPGRNLTMLSLAAGLAYYMDARYLVGGWVNLDVDYPDCTPNFLQFAERTINYGLGFPLGTIYIKGPVLYRSKKEVVKYGREMGVPFHLTRSCYSGQEKPCLECDSCLVRMRAFLANGIRDPLVSEEDWARFQEAECQGGCQDCCTGDGHRSTT